MTNLRTINHALEADYFHTRVRLGIGRKADVEVAQAYAKQAGRSAAIAGCSRDEVSPHIAGFPMLLQQHREGFDEATCALRAGIGVELLSRCVSARTAFDWALREEYDHDMYSAVLDVYEILQNFAVRPLPFFVDVPEIERIDAAAREYVRSMQAIETATSTRKARVASLPSASELKAQVEAATTGGDARSFEFAGYTLWPEPEHGGWSLTNAYGIDYCAFLSTEGDFQWLLDCCIANEDIGPVPPGCEQDDTDPSYLAWDRADNILWDTAEGITERLRSTPSNAK